MGDLDKQPFVAATKRIYSRKYGKRAADNKAAELCSLWEQYLRDPHWHPFKFISDEEGKTLVHITNQPQKSISCHFPYDLIILIVACTGSYW